MDKLLRKHTFVTRWVSGCAAVVLAGALAACGGDEAGSDDPAPAGESGTSGSTAGDPAAAFCQSVEGIETDLTLLQLTEFDEPTEYPDQVSRAAARFADTEPPAEIATSWRHVGDLLALTDDALQDVDVQTEEDIRGALRFDSEEAFGMVIQLPGQAEAVGVYVQDTCQVDLGITPPVIQDVCAVLDTTHLDSVFDGAVPDGENRWWGAGAVECMWDDREGREVGVIVMPAAAMQADLLSDQTLVDTVQLDGPTIEVYDGAFGVLRAGGGHTATTVVGDTGVLASVSSADAQAESLKAIALAGLVAAELG